MPKLEAQGLPISLKAWLTKLNLLSNGGRVYMLVTTADTVKDGQNIIYKELNNQNTEGLFYRTDIGSKANK